jgi:hypothetical protein
MATATHTPPQSFTATLTLNGRDFPFRLWHRPLPLGDAGVVEYYWLDLSALRHVRFNHWKGNARTCVHYWWEAMRSIGNADDFTHQLHLVAALCYPIVSGMKAAQRVVRDASLRPGRAAEADQAALDDDTLDRIRRVVELRDTEALRAELDRALGRTHPPAHRVAAVQTAAVEWIGRGVMAWRQHGTDGLCRFLDETRDLFRKYRRKGFDPNDRGRRNGDVERMRELLDYLGFEIKTRFYTCVANAWVGLIPWLTEHRGLDTHSERFLRFWHYQDQPADLPPGRTAGGLYLPTHAALTVVGAASGGPTRLVVPTACAPPARRRGAPHGLPLGLHPVSGFVMKDPVLCAVAGRYVASGESDLVAAGRAELCPRYWDLMGALLTAAYQYRRALDDQPDQRRVRRDVDVAETICPAGPAAPSNGQRLLRDRRRESAPARPGSADDAYEAVAAFAAARGLACEECRRALRVVDLALEGDDDRLRVALGCPRCGARRTATFDAAEVRSYLTSTASPA